MLKKIIKTSSSISDVFNKLGIDASSKAIVRKQPKESLLFDIPELGETSIVSMGKKNAIVRKDGKDKKMAIEKLGNSYRTDTFKFIMQCKNVFYILQHYITGQPIPYGRIMALNNIQRNAIKRLSRYLKSNLDLSEKQAELLYNIIYEDTLSTKQTIAGEEAEGWIAFCYAWIKESYDYRNKIKSNDFTINFLNNIIDYYRKNNFLTVPQVNSLKKINYDYQSFKIKRREKLNGKIIIRDIPEDYANIILFLLYKVDIPFLNRSVEITIAEVKCFIYRFCGPENKLNKFSKDHLAKGYFKDNADYKKTLSGLSSWLNQLDFKNIIKEELKHAE